jgi:hypothetical protein
MSDTWEAALAAFEVHLDQQYQEFAAGNYDAIGDFVFPDDLGQLPRHLAPIADELNHRSLELIAAIEELANDMSRQLLGLRQRPRFESVATSSFSAQA